jgi:glycosyltransferase involved in cell wall biosynthesis
MGGAEKVVEVFCAMFPDSPIYTSVYDPEAMSPFWRGRDIRTSFMQRLSPRLKVAKALLPLYPVAFESFDFTGYDVVLSSTTTFAKGIVTRPETCHVCYCNNPTRFAWMYPEYVARERLGSLVRQVLPYVVSPLRVWDYAAAQRVDQFVAGSFNSARRIHKFYRRDAVVVQSPIDVSQYAISPVHEPYYLIVSRLQSYKRIDLAIEAFNRLRWPLRIVGDGPDAARLRSLAGPTVTLMGRRPDEEVREHFSRCQAFIFPGEEDFGLTPLEAQAAGRPVLAYGAGGALETIREHETGAFFREQTVDALVEALSGFDPGRYDPLAARANAARFDISVFKSRMNAVIADAFARHQAALREAGRARAGLFATADPSPGLGMPDGAEQGAAPSECLDRRQGEP